MLLGINSKVCICPPVGMGLIYPQPSGENQNLPKGEKPTQLRGMFLVTLTGHHIFLTHAVEAKIEKQKREGALYV